MVTEETLREIVCAIRVHAQVGNGALTRFDLLKGHEQAKFRLGELCRLLDALDDALDVFIAPQNSPKARVDAERVCRDLGLTDVRFDKRG